ncbi:MAG: hypothetical protein WBQ18_00380 [Solirubrobacteraceae bacterium]
MTSGFFTAARVAAVTALILCLGSAAAGARRPARGAERTAIISAMRLAHQLGPSQTAACLTVNVSTVDGSWATVGFVYAQRCAGQEANGITVMHRRNGRWRFVTAGSAFSCPIPGHIPRRVQRDLRLSCVPGMGAAVPRGRLPQPIYAFTDTAAPIDSQNPRMIRPSGFLLFQDGQWALEKLRWTGWGSPVARATGISSSSTGTPNAAAGKRIRTWAHVTLSNPGRFQGHEVYRCFSLTVPPPASNLHLCLARVGRIWVLQTTALALTGFLSPDHRVWCGLSNTQSFCVTGGQPVGSNTNPPQRGATLSPSGKVTTCNVPVPTFSAQCTQNWDPQAPVLRYGAQTEADGVLCTSARNGITCVLAAGAHKGRGFRVSPSADVPVG